MEMELLLQAGSPPRVEECKQPKQDEVKHFNKEAEKVVVKNEAYDKKQLNSARSVPQPDINIVSLPIVNGKEISKTYDADHR